MAKAEKQVKPEKAHVYIVGESPMVEEYAAICAEHGYEVSIAWNEPPEPKPKLDHEIKQTNSIPQETSLGIELTNTDREQKKGNVQKLDGVLSSSNVILSSSLTVTATEQSRWIKGKHRIVGISALPTLIQKQLVEVAPTALTPKETLEVVTRFYRSVGREIEIVQDRVGMVLPRILCQLINESAFALMEDVASPQDIDTAMKLGASYPRGPVEWVEQVGIKQVYAVLNALQHDLQEERYRVAPLLRQVALAGEWWIRK